MESREVEDEYTEWAKGLHPKARPSSFVQEKDGLLKELNAPKVTNKGRKQDEKSHS